MKFHDSKIISTKTEDKKLIPKLDISVDFLLIDIVIFKELCIIEKEGHLNGSCWLYEEVHACVMQEMNSYLAAVC